ncbi:hypothetical protein [Ilumatobacter nonamiensis]|uniref:hypothetical protein n=1 Tax=Ilumatobacter nonamiensis TaxID=467093 RepID=UPI000346E123|nr:hypothetical protein [Ilumatobacter nonamiensis]
MAIAIVRDSEAKQSAPESDQRPKLSVVAVGGRPRWIAIVGGIVVFIVLAAMLGAAVFHTQLAQRQLKVDELERLVDDERVRFDELRRDRAVLRSPQRISDEATALGMVPSDSVRFIEIDPMALARQLAAAGVTDGDTTRVIVDTGPLEQFRDVKAVSEGQP